MKLSMAYKKQILVTSFSKSLEFLHRGELIQDGLKIHPLFLYYYNNSYIINSFYIINILIVIKLAMK